MLNTVSRTFGIFVLMFLRMKPSVQFAFPTMLNVRIPVEMAGDINPKILEIISDGLQYLAMESACNFKGTPGTCHLHHLAFRGVNSISHLVSHAESLSMSFWRVALSSSPLIFVSIYILSFTSGRKLMDSFVKFV